MDHRPRIPKTKKKRRMWGTVRSRQEDRETGTLSLIPRFPGSSIRLLAALCVFCIGLLTGALSLSAEKLLIPMDLAQTDHLKAYGVAYWALLQAHDVEWLLNYRGGAFMMDHAAEAARECRLRDIAFLRISGAQVARIYAEIDDGNMDVVHLEAAPRIAVYTPPSQQPWDDAVTLALTYAEIPYDTLWDQEVLAGKLSDYDWLHLHHEDFTGQYGKFYGSYGGRLC